MKCKCKLINATLNVLQDTLTLRVMFGTSCILSMHNIDDMAISNMYVLVISSHEAFIYSSCDVIFRH